jgi:hypothetical protein
MARRDAPDVPGRLNLTFGEKVRATLVAIIGAAIFAWAANWLVGEMTKPELYLSLEGVMADRKRLWNLPRDQGGTRDRDVSGIVCPMVDRARLDSLHQQRPDLVKRNVITQLGGVPDGTVAWILHRRIDFFSVQSLSVYLQPDGACEGRYSHTH